MNFDHFEILERNNFDDSSAAENSETAKAEDKRSKSMANAQVMLRIGGEDIHDCNRVILHHQAAAKDNNLYSEHQQPSYNNQLRYPYFPHPYNAYPYFHHQPYSFPGYYFNPNPLSNYLPSSYQTYNNQLVPTELATSKIIYCFSY